MGGILSLNPCAGTGTYQTGHEIRCKTVSVGISMLLLAQATPLRGQGNILEGNPSPARPGHSRTQFHGLKPALRSLHRSVSFTRKVITYYMLFYHDPYLFLFMYILYYKLSIYLVIFPSCVDVCIYNMTAEVTASGFSLPEDFFSISSPGFKQTSASDLRGTFTGKKPKICFQNALHM